MSDETVHLTGNGRFALDMMRAAAKSAAEQKLSDAAVAQILGDIASLYKKQAATT